MCSLFGIIDYNNSLPIKTKRRILRELSCKCEVRGTDATGIAYIKNNGSMKIMKKALPAHKIKFNIRGDNPKVIMGHTRFTTQGTEHLNYNNHPFYSDKLGFSLAHNGVIYNDTVIRREEKLPETKIETDSYIAVQLIDNMDVLNGDSIKYMIDTIKGSYCFTILSKDNELYIIKGDNPICIAKFDDYYIYASTEEILRDAFEVLGLETDTYLEPIDGTITVFKPDDEPIVTSFDYQSPWDTEDYYDYNFYDLYPDDNDLYGYGSFYDEYTELPDGLVYKSKDQYTLSDPSVEYYNDLVSYGKYLGYSENVIRSLCRRGHDLEEIEEILLKDNVWYYLML